MVDRGVWLLREEPIIFGKKYHDTVSEVKL
jgi:hypothetical protein